VSIHVFDAGDGREYLRFDCFEVGFHYHYIHQELGQHEVMEHDVTANGPLLPWALACVHDRLPAMLEKAGAPPATTRVDPDVVAAAYPKITSAVDAALAPRGGGTVTR
jgi:hypothetical protein